MNRTKKGKEKWKRGRKNTKKAKKIEGKEAAN
jgi:hypothetical protein